jgi:hypothetical protein
MTLSDDQQKEYQEEAKQRWGHTKAYQQSVQRVKNWTAADRKRIEEEGVAIRDAMAGLMGKDVSDTEVQTQTHAYYEYMQNFYDCSYEMFAGLGEMYVEDPRFTEHYDNVKPGLAIFMRDAMKYYAEQKK